MARLWRFPRVAVLFVAALLATAVLSLANQEDERPEHGPTQT